MSDPLEPRSASALMRMLSAVVPPSVDDPFTRAVLKGLLAALVIAAANFSPSLLELLNATQN